MENEVLTIRISKRKKVEEKDVICSFKGNKNSNDYRLVRYSKNGELYSGIEVCKKIGWSLVASGKREFEPAMWESYWMLQVSNNKITMQDAAMRILAYMVNVFGSMEDLLIYNKNPKIARALKSALLNLNEEVEV